MALRMMSVGKGHGQEDGKHHGPWVGINRTKVVIGKCTLTKVGEGNSVLWREGSGQGWIEAGAWWVRLSKSGRDRHRPRKVSGRGGGAAGVPGPLTRISRSCVDTHLRRRVAAPPPHRHRRRLLTSSKVVARTRGSSWHSDSRLEATAGVLLGREASARPITLGTRFKGFTCWE